MKTLNAFFALALCAFGLVHAAYAQDFALNLNVPAYQVVRANNSSLSFDFNADPFGGSEDLSDTETSTVEYSTNHATARKITVAVAAAQADDWNNLTLSIAPQDPVASELGAGGSAGTRGSDLSDQTADVAAHQIAGGVTLAHASMDVAYTVAITNTTEATDQGNARAFDITYTIAEE